MDHDDDGRGSRRGRLMGKLFGAKEKEPKVTASSDAVNDFLHASSDNLHPTVAPPAVPSLTKLDTRTAPRYPGALDAGGVGGQRPAAKSLSHQDMPIQTRARSPQRAPRKNRKGQNVRFVDTPPEVIGEGGDETATPVSEISKLKQMRPAPPPSPQPAASPGAAPPRSPRGEVPEDFVPAPIRRTQTGYSSITSPRSHSYHAAQSGQLSPNPQQSQRLSPSPRQGEEIPPGTAARTRFLDPSMSQAKDENRRSFIEIQQAEMRQAEGAAFAQAVRKESGNSPSVQNPFEETQVTPSAFDESPDLSKVRPMSPETQHNTFANKPTNQRSESPSSVYSGNSHYGTSSDLNRRPSTNQHSRQFEPMPPPQPSSSPPVYQPQRPAYQQAPSKQTSPTSQQNQNPNTQTSQYNAMPSPVSSSATSLATRHASVRVTEANSAAGEDALNAFVARTVHLSELFRLHAEAVRPISSCNPHDFARAAVWWFLKGRMALETSVRARPVSAQDQAQAEKDRQQSYTNLAKAHWLVEEAIPEVLHTSDADIDDVRKLVIYNLKKLAVSMKRNGFLPPEEAFLPQTIDKGIWVEYPKLSQDMVALLTGNAAAAISGERRAPTAADALDALPIGDTPEMFCFGRFQVNVYLMEQGAESQSFHFPCFLTMVRPMKSSSPAFVLGSQNGEVHLTVSNNKNSGPTWESARWKHDNCAVEVKLPRGFMLAIQCSQQDYRGLWNMYDFGIKTQASLYPRTDEQCVFRSTVKSFQFFDADPQSRTFPKEAIPACDVALFEKIHHEKTALGPRSWHRGFRVAVVTGTKTRTLSSLNPVWSPQQAIPFGFLRGENGDPALLLKCDSGRQKGTMVLTFGDEQERLRFHTLLTGTAVLHDETTYADVPLRSFMLQRTLDDAQGMPGVNKLPWQTVRIINDDHGGDDMPPTLLSDKLRIVVDSKVGTITDRVNVETGELRIRLEVNDAKSLAIMRKPQSDMTMSVSDSQVGREAPKDMSGTLQLLQTMAAIRTFRFTSLNDLHTFQHALTGFKIMYDGLAATFAIARRRMVVPIHKKWEAGYTRLQIAQQDGVIQLIAFFPDFAHGQCMNFVLKGTDVFETFSRSGKYGLKFVDAKFPMPRKPENGDTSVDDGGFLCLDYPDLPGEHDDISVFFEKEEDRDRLVKCLPAPVKEGSRLAGKINF